MATSARRDGMAWSFLPAIAAVVVGIAIGVSDASQVEGIYPEDPLQVSDIIVRGVIEDITPIQFDISSGDFGTEPSFIRGSEIRVRVHAVLRGTWHESRISMVVLNDDRSLLKGREYILCGSWAKYARTFVTGTHIGIYANGGRGRWIKRPSPWGMATEPDTLSTTEVRARLERGSLRYVTRESEVILTGTIISERDSAYAYNGQNGRTKYYLLQVDAVLKGRVKARYVTVAIPQLREYVPVPIRPTPPVRRGEEWLLFLKREDWGAYPFAGRNSMLLIDGDDLLYNSEVRCPRTRDEAIAYIRYQVRCERH